MSEREAAVAWLEKDYDQDLELFAHRISPEMFHFGTLRRGRGPHQPMFMIKDQNG